MRRQNAAWLLWVALRGTNFVNTPLSTTNRVLLEYFGSFFQMNVCEQSTTIMLCLGDMNGRSFCMFDFAILPTKAVLLGDTCSDSVSTPGTFGNSPKRHAEQNGRSFRGSVLSSSPNEHTERIQSLSKSFTCVCSSPTTVNFLEYHSTQGQPKSFTTQLYQCPPK